MRRRPPLLLLVPLLALMAAGCTDVRDRVDGLRGDADELTDDVRFCLALARAVSAVESMSPETAAEAAEEVLAHAPPELEDDVRTVVEALRRARDEGNNEALRDPELREALERLHDDTRVRCDPR